MILFDTEVRLTRPPKFRDGYSKVHREMRALIGFDKRRQHVQPIAGVCVDEPYVDDPVRVVIQATIRYLFPACHLATAVVADVQVPEAVGQRRLKYKLLTDSASSPRKTPGGAMLDGALEEQRSPGTQGSDRPSHH
jgi:hypothetical protein